MSKITEELIEEVLNKLPDEMDYTDISKMICGFRKVIDDENTIQKIYALYGNIYDKDYIGNRCHNSGIFEDLKKDGKKIKKIEIKLMLGKLLLNKKVKPNNYPSFKSGEEIVFSFESLNGHHIGGSCYILTFIGSESKSKLKILIDMGAMFNAFTHGLICPNCNKVSRDNNKVCPICKSKLIEITGQVITPPVNRLKLYEKIKDIDLVIFSHGHLDHIGFAPLLTALGSPFYYKDIKIYSHILTKMSSYILLSNLHKSIIGNGNMRTIIDDDGNIQKNLGWNSLDLDELMKRWIPLMYNQRVNVCNNVFFELINAGHEPGSAMILLSVNNTVILFTGDYNTRKTTLLLNPIKIDDVTAYIKDKYGYVNVMISEGTYIGSDMILPDRNEIIDKFSLIINEAFNKTKDGSIYVMIPIYGSRISEITILYEAFEKGKLDIPLDNYKSVKVLIDGVAKEYYKLFRNELINNALTTEEVKKIVNECKNPFMRPPTFQNVELCEMVNWIPKDDGLIPTSNLNDKNVLYIIFTTAGMLSGGPILGYLELFGNDKDNYLLLTGYMADGTLGSILKKQLADNKQKKLYYYNDRQNRNIKLDINCKIEELHLSHHCSENDIVSFIESVSPENLIFIHTENKNRCSEIIKLLTERNAIKKGYIGDCERIKLHPEFINITLNKETIRDLFVISRITGKNPSRIIRDICRNI